jgi:hypothetical protein
MHTHVIFILKRKEGEIGKQERDRERAGASVGALQKEGSWRRQ